MDEREQWLALIDGRSSPEEKGALLSSASTTLGAILAAQPEASQLILEIIGKRLGDPLGDRSWEALDESLATYLGTGPAFLLTWLVLADPSDQSRIRDLEAHASPETAALLKSVLGVYGREIREAFTRWQQFPDDWRTVFRDIYTDVLNNNRPLIRLRILKFNGEEFLIEGTPTSFIALARNIVLTLHPVATPEAFSPEAREEFEEAVERLRRLMTPDDELSAGQSAASPEVPDAQSR